MKTILRLLLLTVATQFLCAASCGPSVRLADGTRLTTGWSLARQSTGEVRSVKGHGYELTHSSTSTDETKVPLSAIRWAGAAAIAKQTFKGTEATESTARNANNNAASVEKARLGADVQKEAIQSGVTTIPQ